jgi:nucleotide-binding universal stress UspA family protein
MSILCGVDFSEASTLAMAVAARLARQLGVPLHLVHAVELPEWNGDPGESGSLAMAGLARLRDEAARLRAEGVTVESHVRAGAPDEVALRVAKELGTELVVVGALGRRSSSEWQLGSHAERIAERAQVPVLVVRNSEPFISWLNGTRKLKVVLGLDPSRSSEVAADWLVKFCRLGNCEVLVTHLYWPPEEMDRLGFGGTLSWEDNRELERALEREYMKRFPALSEQAKVSYRFEPHVGRTGDGLASYAARAGADLIVVGCHDRDWLGRAWHGSVSHHVLRRASASVACIAAPRGAAQRSSPRAHDVLVPTDLSKTGNAAIPLAYSIVSYGGTVHFLHVVETSRWTSETRDVLEPPSHTASDRLAQVRAQLAALVPSDLAGAVTNTEFHVIEAADPKAAILQVAERLNVDLICMGTHGRGGVSRTLLGSVAGSVVAGTRLPVLLAREPLA